MLFFVAVVNARGSTREMAGKLLGELQCWKVGVILAAMRVMTGVEIRIVWTGARASIPKAIWEVREESEYLSDCSDEVLFTWFGTQNNVKVCCCEEKLCQ